MEFKTDPYSLLPLLNQTVSLSKLLLSSNKDVFYRAKQKELIDQYVTARNFLILTKTSDWSYFFAPSPNQQANTYFELTFTANFYEAALMFYNIVVDLSWTTCYLCSEFVLYKNNQPIDFSQSTSLEDSISFLRTAERNVTNPTSDTSPFLYLKKMNPEYEKAIDLICNFWSEFAKSPIRQQYNFIKHKGKPLYNEIAALDTTRLFSYTRKNSDGTTTQVASNIKDVQFKTPLLQSIDELLLFDDEVLFPYLQELFNILEKIFDPSPLL